MGLGWAGSQRRDRVGSSRVWGPGQGPFLPGSKLEAILGHPQDPAPGCMCPPCLYPCT